MNFVDYLFSDTSTLDKPFLLGTKESIAYPQLYAQIVSLAAGIRKEVGTGQNIILVSNNNLFFIMAYLGILKSGNVVVPLNPATEPGNLSYIIKQCGSKTAFISNGTPIVSDELHVVFNETGMKELINSRESFIEQGSSDVDSMAEIIYTSGSTGVPKGVIISHKNLTANTSSIIQYLKLTSNDTMLIVLPFYYCYGLSLLHTHLKVGGSIALNNSFIFIGGILRDLNLYRCTGFAGVPSHYQILLRKSKSFITTSFPYLRYVTQAGGKLPTLFIHEFIKALPAVKFFVMYGQTEATARLSYLPPDVIKEKSGSIGKGIPGVTLKVVNENGKEIKTGEQGEIIARGDNIMKGYFKDKSLTDITIRDGWLYTGDIATIDDDGYIFIVSRKKEIIKVGGKRVSPKEIEEVILMLPEVIDCTISSIEDPLLGEAIVATLVLNDEGKNTINADKVLEHCHKHLSAHKIPSHITFENNIHVNAAGKKIKK